jgi:hypothetical protein
MCMLQGCSCSAFFFCAGYPPFSPMFEFSRLGVFEETTSSLSRCFVSESLAYLNCQSINDVHVSFGKWQWTSLSLGIAFVSSSLQTDDDVQPAGVDVDDRVTPVRVSRLAGRMRVMVGS